MGVLKAFLSLSCVCRRRAPLGSAAQPLSARSHSRADTLSENTYHAGALPSSPDDPPTSRTYLPAMRCAVLAVVATVPVACALHFPMMRAGSIRMQGAPPPAAGDGAASLFEEPPPITWASEGWNWGSADGEAHNVAARVREDFAKPHRRSALISYCKTGSVDMFDVKMVLALSCQRARNLGYDEPDGRWESLMDEMAAGIFEDDHMIDREKLADAVNKRLPSPVEWKQVHEYDGAKELVDIPTRPIAAALEQLEFVKNGL